METPLCSDDGGPTGPFSMLLPREEISQSDLILVFMPIILTLLINPTDFTEIPIMLMICSRWCYSGKWPFVIWSPSFSTPSRVPLPYKVFSTPSTMISRAPYLCDLVPRLDLPCQAHANDGRTLQWWCWWWLTIIMTWIMMMMMTKMMTFFNVYHDPIKCSQPPWMSRSHWFEEPD